MPACSGFSRNFARIALAGIRLVNGTLALVAPAVLVRRLGFNPETNPSALYAFRLFGVRTILLGTGLLLGEGPVREYVIRTAIVVHASDTAAATIGALRRELPPRAAATTILISGINTILAVVARPRKA